MVRLEAISVKNIWDIVALAAADDQKNFVASNSESFIDAYTAVGTGCSAFPFAIFDDETPVGFLMIGHNEAALYELYGGEGDELHRVNYSLRRLMIDRRYQKKGYGRQAIQLALDFIRTWPCGKAKYCFLSYEPHNTAAKALYASMGFVETGEMDGDELHAVLKL